LPALEVVQAALVLAQAQVMDLALAKDLVKDLVKAAGWHQGLMAIWMYRSWKEGRPRLQRHTASS